MNIQINAKEVVRLVEMTPPSQNIMLAGKHGIGKSQILTDYFTSIGQRVVTLFLGQMSDPGDLIGLPHKNETTGKTEFMPPYWFPVDGEPVVLFLDELNRARPEILQTIMDLALNRCLAGRKLPAGSRIIAAVNDGDEYQLTDLDPALVSRFNIYTFAPTVSDWVLWATDKGVDARILNFIQTNEKMLDSAPAEEGNSSLEKSPDRRAWERVSDIIKGESEISVIMQKTIAGVVGAKATAAFVSSLKNDDVISAETLLKSFDKEKGIIAKYAIDQLAILNERIFCFIETKGKLTKSMDSSLLKYLEWLLAERREAMAHFCSLYESNNYINANIYMMTSLPGFFTNIAQFLKSL